MEQGLLRGDGADGTSCLNTGWVEKVRLAQTLIYHWSKTETKTKQRQPKRLKVCRVDSEHWRVGSNNVYFYFYSQDPPEVEYSIRKLSILSIEY